MSKEKEMEGDNWVDEEEECDCGGDKRVLRSAGRLAGAAVVTTSLSAILVCFPHRGISIFKLSWRFAYFIFFVGFTLRILLFLPVGDPLLYCTEPLPPKQISHHGRLPSRFARKDQTPHPLPDA